MGVGDARGGERKGGEGTKVIKRGDKEKQKL